jgi:hypothetical protein
MCFAIDYTIVLRSSFMYRSISLSINVTFVIDFHNIAFFFVSLLPIDLYVYVFCLYFFLFYIFAYMQLFVYM